MGFFSWKTQDTNKSISNTYSSRKTFKIVMTDNKGNKWIEEDYEGYGIFGGKDYYELVAEMNGFTKENIPKNWQDVIVYDSAQPSLRDVGIDLFFNNHVCKFLFPSLSENGDYHNGIKPEDCEYQGFFY